ncbi:hypothetical protein CC1G_05430 [Coprinopsis cinerea okayama7|uniref:Cutinase n=1 Tax=Coprinopsis cinerea (strain Okayama-7 / 130 / ATCC MYA-4618 / FGSC 9003) TaxID=240176 RepID=A8NQ30_COPC7|nr:hypothetical protein CC1G_05430 [Coprinopsis cinerea okayama7\|eukprot:XP_001835468.1 hypothetical protein CC1G_05430 [Coprinopsis cinerea okayama7\
MVSKSLTSLVLLAFTLTGVAAAPAPTTPCAQVHIIAARASTEPPGPGIVGQLITQIQNQSSQTVSTDSVDYPATLENYNESSSAGTAALKTHLTNQANRCPNQKIVLIGYSQGAHIIGDTLAGGGGGLLGTRTPAIDSSIANRVVAVAKFGDPRHVAGKSYNEGTARRDGMFPRGLTQDYSLTFRSRVKSWCDFNDLFCASGLSTIVHLTYLERYQNDAARFVLDKIGG